jgi:EAL domain-containing protein (putative c-di-GMP-specific phosphodiesterase class I)
MEVIAEGVETEDQFRLLTEKGCDGVQGYLFSRALPPLEILHWLDSYRAQKVH